LATTCLAQGEYSTLLTRQELDVPDTILTKSSFGPFAKEPNGIGDECVRGTIILANKQMGFLFDRSNKLLYVDFDNDKDLTNDPNNTFEPSTIVGAISGQKYHFQDIPVPSHRDWPVVLSGSIVFEDRTASPTFRIQYCQGALVDLDGLQLRFMFLDIDGNGMADHAYLQPVRDGKGQPIELLDLPDQIFIGGRLYQISLDRFPILTLWHIDAPMGQLVIKGKVDRLMLSSDHRLLWLEPSADRIPVPAGVYTFKSGYILTRNGKVRVPPYGGRIEIRPDQTTQVQIDRPLQHLVQVDRSGRNLVLTYWLLDYHGRPIDIREVIGDANAPRFRIYKDNWLVGSGRFEFG